MMTEKRAAIQKYQNFEFAPFPTVILVGQGLSVEYINQCARPLLKQSFENVKGKPVELVLQEIFSGDELETLHEVCFINGQSYTVPQKKVISLADGTEKAIWFDIANTPMYDDVGKVIGVISYFLDVSHKVPSENLVRQQEQPEILQQLIDSSPELIIVIDRYLKFLAVNKTYEEFVQKSRTDLIGKEILNVYSEARDVPQLKLLERVLQGEKVHLKVHPSISRPNIWFDTHYVPLVIQGEIQGAIILSRDITHIVRSEREFSNVNRQLQEAQRLTKLGSWEWDIASGTIFWSDEMYRIYGYEEKFDVDFVKATERMSRENAERSSRRTQQHVQNAIERFKETGEQLFDIPPTEFAIHLPTGEQKLLRNTGKIELTSEGTVHRILGALQDVTEIRSTEEKLRQLINELEVKNRELESFNYVASHDLKEPLRKIQNFIDRIRNSSDDDITDFLEKIDDAAWRMSKLIDSILTLSQASNADVVFVDVDLNKVLEHCFSDLEIKIKETKAQIVAEKLPTIKGSDLQMVQVFSNLLGNALKFCDRTPIVNISCKRTLGSQIHNDDVRRATEYWQLSISDNGIGFDTKHREQIFEPFKRLHTKREYSGTGIGLSIVKKIIERHHGFIEADSVKGKGTTFYLFFPISA
jgi:PAS domain S-box-containing protein